MDHHAIDLEVSPYDRFSDAEFQRRHAAVRRILAEQGLDGMIAYANAASAANVRYLTGGAPYGTHVLYLFFPTVGEPLLVSGVISHTIAIRASAIVPVDWGPDTTTVVSKIAARIHDLGLSRGRLGLVELDTVRNRGFPSVYLEELHRQLPEATFTWITGAIENLRRIKSEEEIRALQKSAEMTETALAAMVAAAKPGATEHELVGAFSGAAVRAGGTVEVTLLKSTPMVGSNLCTPWPRPTNRVLQRGDVILNELAVGYLGYSTQLLRPIAIGRPTEQYQRLFDLAVEVYRSVQPALKPGATEKDIQAAAAAINRSDIGVEAPICHGWSQWSEYGYHVAMPGREGVWSTRPTTFEANMSVTIEPNPCTPDFRAGVFFGDLHIIREDGAHSLHRWPLEFIVV